MAKESVYFLTGSTLLRAELTGSVAREVIPNLAAAPLPRRVALTALAITTDGSHIAYRCSVELCLADTATGTVQHVALDYAVPSRANQSFGLAWSADDQRLAVTIAGGGSPTQNPTRLLIIDRNRHTVQEYSLGPQATLGEPQWTPDGRFVFVSAFPRGGRRIVAIDTAAGQVTDLSQPGWDAFCSLAPDGSSLLLWNARGGFWSVPLLRR